MDDNHILVAKFHSMRNRCNNKRDPANYKNYGGRGIKICKEWSSSRKFISWAKANGYKPGLTLDRIDNNGDYSPENCRWITQKEQCNNRRTSRFLEYKGERKTLVQWAEVVGIKKTTLHNRLQYFGWSLEKSLTTPVRERRIAS